MSSQKYVQIWHNPSCSKSRQTLSLLQSNDIDLEIIEYLQAPPTAQMLEQALKLLGMQPRDLMRKHEEIYQLLKLDEADFDDQQLIAAMHENPTLIERPVVIVNNEKAKIGRPPESILEIL